MTKRSELTTPADEGIAAAKAQNTTANSSDLFKQTATNLLKRAEASLEAALETVRGAMECLDAADDFDPVTAEEVKEAGRMVAVSAQADSKAQDVLAATSGETYRPGK